MSLGYLATNAVRSSSLARCQASMRLGGGGGGVGARGTPSAVAATGGGGGSSWCGGGTPTSGVSLFDAIAETDAKTAAVSDPPDAAGTTGGVGAGGGAALGAAGAFARAAVPIRPVRMVEVLPPRVSCPPAAARPRTGVHRSSFARCAPVRCQKHAGGEGVR